MDDEFGVNAGAVYVFENENGYWVFKAKLASSDGTAHQHFGYDVAIFDETIVVGAISDENYTGAAYVFEKPISGWVDTIETAKLVASDGLLESYFGWSVAIDNDVIVIGAPSDDINGINRGAAYIFEKPMEGWVDTLETAKLTASDAQNYDSFGISIDISGNTIVVGADLNNEMGFNSGAVYVFEESNLGWVSATESEKFTASDGTDEDRFGNSVAIEGSNIVVGAYGDDDDRGAAYVFSRSTDSWLDGTQVAKLIAADRVVALDDIFGVSVDIDNGIIIIGASAQDHQSIINTGSVYIFEQKNGVWSDQFGCVQLVGSNINNGRVGHSVALFNNTILAGAYYGNTEFGNSGKALFFNKR